MVYTRANGAEGGTNTTVVTTANSGGTSGDAFAGVAGSPTFSSTHARDGSLAYFYPVSVTTFTYWDSFASVDQYQRAYVYFTAKPSAGSQPVMSSRTAAGAAVASCGTTSTPHWYVSCGANTVTGTTTPVVNTWYRVELRTHSNASAGYAEMRIYDNTGTLLEDLGPTTANTAITDISRPYFGVSSGNTWTNGVWLDGLAVSDVAWVGAGAVAVPLADAGAAAEASTVAAGVPQAGAGAGAETFAAAAAVPPADGGSAGDPVAVAAGVPAADVGGVAADAAGVAAGGAVRRYRRRGRGGRPCRCRGAGW